LTGAACSRRRTPPQGQVP